MGDFKKIPILFFFLQIATSALAEDVEEAKRLAEIEALEKEKGELYKQINDAIDDSVKHLAESNDTDAELGIELITDLKNQLKVLNGTNDTELLSSEFEFQNNTRRKDGKSKSKKLKKDDDDENSLDKRHRDLVTFPSRKKKGKDKIFEDDLLKKIDKSKKHRERYENRQKMQSRIEDWLKKKEAEKLKIKKYIYESRLKANAGIGRLEKCYRYGLSKKKKTKKHKGYYPCCRKCCKKSYMGCLK